MTRNIGSFVPVENAAHRDQHKIDVLTNANAAKAATETFDFPIDAEVAAIGPRSIESSSPPIDQTLTAAVKSLDEAREALNFLCQTFSGGASAVMNIAPVLLTVPQVCELLGYHKTKVYDLMRRGLLPYVTDSKTGHRRIEYRAVQQFVKRMRCRNSERKAS